MNETRGNSRTKPMNRGDFRGEMNSLKDSEKTNECILNICCFFNNINGKYTEQIHKTFCFYGNRTEEFIIKLNEMMNKFLHKK